MATIYRDPKSPFYYMRFQVKGKVYREPTGKANAQAARVVMRERLAEVRGETTYEDAFEGLLAKIGKLETRKEQDDVRHDLAARLLGGLEHKVRIVDAWPLWLKAPKKRMDLKPRTLDSYRSRWDAFTEWLKEHYPKAKYLHDVSGPMAQEYAAHLTGKGVSASTYNLHVGLLRSLFKVLRSRGGMRVNAWDEVVRQQLATESRRNLTAAELTEVVKHADETQRVMIAVGIYTGMRLGDVCTLRWDEIDLEQKLIRHVPMKTERTKRGNGKIVTLPIHPVLEAGLRVIDQRGDYVFPGIAERYSVDPSAESKRFQKLFTEAGIQTLKEGTGREAYEAAKVINEKTAVYRRGVVEVGFHSLRHSFISMLAANSVPQVAVMEMVGHGSPAMTEHYSHADMIQKARAIATLPDYTRHEEETAEEPSHP